MQRRTKFSISAGIAMVLVAAVWIIFAPVQVGGKSRYVIVSGNSMEPLYHKGDLVLIRTADDYRVGEVVTYRHPEVGPVIHRIIGREGARYVFQGDNNDFIDGVQPLEEDLLGTQWIHIPRVGAYLTWIREPRNLAIVAGVIGVIIMSSFARGEQARQPAPNASRDGGDGPGRRAASLIDVLQFLVVVVVAAALLAAVAFSRPLRTDRKVDVVYEHSGVFSYTTQPSNITGVYDNNVAQPGDPIFRTVADDVDLAFHYNLDAEDNAAEIAGTWRLIAEVADTNGWTRTLELVPETSFSGGAFDTTATLALADVQALIDQVEVKTGLDRPQYFVSVVPVVQVRGSVGGERVADSFTPRLTFILDALQLRLQEPDEPDAVLEQSKPGRVVQTTGIPNSLSVIAWQIDVGAARTWSLAAGGAAFGLASVLSLLLLAERRRARAGRPAASTAIEVRAWADLAILAQQLGVPVQSDMRGRYRRYFVESDRFTWQFLEIEPHTGSAA